MKSAVVKLNDVHGILLLSSLPTSPIGLESKLCKISPVAAATISREGDVTRIEVTLRESRENWVPIYREIKEVLTEHFRTDIDDVPFEDLAMTGEGSCLAVEAC